MQEPKPYTIDTSELPAEKKQFEVKPLMDELLSKVAVMYPLFDFKVTDRCINYRWVHSGSGDSKQDFFLQKVKVFQDGERIGSLLYDTRGYGVNGEPIVGVENFRITKYRGHNNASFSKDLKVVLRLVKKNLTPRQDDELVTWIKQQISGEMHNLANNAENIVRYGIDHYAIAYAYVMGAYDAHKRGENNVTLSTTLPNMRDMDAHIKNMRRSEEAKLLKGKLDAGTGYGVGTQADGTTVLYTYATGTVKKYKDFDDLPKVVADKLSVFKVLEVEDFFLAYGAKFKDNFYYIVDDALPSA